MASLSASVRTHRGRVRAHNEDSVVRTDRLVAVADGLGGHAAGELASRLAVQRMGELGMRTDATPDDLRAAIRAANRLIYAEGRHNPRHAGLGTTLCGVALVAADDVEQCALFNVGDSRIYSFIDAALAQCSVDHSEVQELQDAGLLTADEAVYYPRRNIVTRWLGAETDPEPDIWLQPPPAGARYLACTDGLTNEIDDAMIAELLGAHAASSDASDALIERALEAGGRDNISVAVVDIGA